MIGIKKAFLILSFGCIALSPDSSQAQTLEDTLVQVYQTNPQLEAERAKLRETDEQVSQALSYWRPSIDAQANAGQIYQNTPNNPLVVPPSESLSTHAVGVQVTQPIFRGFRTVSGVHAAEKQVAAERANLQNTEEQIFLQTATAYLDVVRDQQIVALNIEYQDVLRRQLHDTHERFSAHDVTRTDFDQATARLERSQAGRMQAEGNLSGHRATFLRLAGEMPGKLEMPKLDMPPVKDLDEAIVLARKQNPAILAASYSEDQAHAEVELNKGSLLPEVSLVGGAQRQWGVSDIIPGRQDTIQVLAQVTIPLYRAGSDYSKTRAAVETVTERRMQLEDARRQAEQMVTAAWQNMLTARAVISADKAEEAATKRALHGVRVEIPAGTRDTLDVLNAEQEHMDARISLVEAQHDEALSIFQIRAAIGALTAEAMRLPVQRYNPEVHYEAARAKLIGFDVPDGENTSRPDPTSGNTSDISRMTKPNEAEKEPIPPSTAEPAQTASASALSPEPPAPPIPSEQTKEITNSEISTNEHTADKPDQANDEFIVPKDDY